MSSVIKLLRDYSKLVMKLVDVSVTIIPSTAVPANSSVKLYDDTGDLIFIYTPYNWAYTWILQVNSDVVSYNIIGDQLYRSMTAVITSGRTVITVKNGANQSAYTLPITVVKFVFRKA